MTRRVVAVRKCCDKIAAIEGTAAITRAGNRAGAGIRYSMPEATMSEPTRPNPPRFPFVVLKGDGEPLRNASGKIAGFRKKADAEAFQMIADATGKDGTRVDRRELSDDIEIEGEPTN